MRETTIEPLILNIVGWMFWIIAQPASEPIKTALLIVCLGMQLVSIGLSLGLFINWTRK